jgi:DNA-binding Lrp family transcriptional regulator
MLPQEGGGILISQGLQNVMLALDDLDRGLIGVLRRDGRASPSKIAKLISVSRATVQTRLNRLTESGAVLGFTARVRQEQEGSAVRAIMSIEVAGKSTTAVIRSLHGIPELQSLHTRTAPGTSSPKLTRTTCRISIACCAWPGKPRASPTVKRALCSVRSEPAPSNERHFRRRGSTLAHRPTVHGAAPVRGWRDVDKKLIVLAAAEFQELARPFVSGGDPAAHGLTGDRSRPDDEDGDVRRHADLKPHGRLEGVKRDRTRAPNNNGTAATSGKQK